MALGLKLSASVSGYNTDKTGNNVQTNLSRGPWGNSSASRDYAMLNHMPKYIPWETSIYDEVTGKNRSYYVSPWAGPQILDTNLTRLLADILYGIILQKRHPVQESTISQMAIMPTSH